MNKVKIIINYLLSFILSVVLLMIIIIVIMKSSIFNKEYVKKVIVNNNYYENISNDIRNNMENYMVSSGLPEKVLDDIYTIDNIEDDINLFLDNLYKGKTTEIDTTNLKEKLDSNIDNYLDNHDLKVTSKETLELFKDDISKIYSEEVTLYNLINSFINPFVKLNNIFTKLLPILIIVFVIIILVNIVLFKSSLIGVILSSSGIMLVIVKLLILNKIDIQNVLIISSYFSNIISKIYNNIGEKMLLWGIFLFIFGLLLNTFVSNKDNKVLKNK